MTDKELRKLLSRLEDLHKRATSAPWEAEPGDVDEDDDTEDGRRCEGIYMTGVRSDEIVTTDSGCYGPCMVDAELIVETRNALPILIAALRERL